MEKNIRRCEICGKVYDNNGSCGFITLDHSRYDDLQNYSRRRCSGGTVEYKTCIDCHDKISKTIEDMVHGGM